MFNVVNHVELFTYSLWFLWVFFEDKEAGEKKEALVLSV